MADYTSIFMDLERRLTELRIDLQATATAVNNQAESLDRLNKTLQQHADTQEAFATRLNNLENPKEPD